MDGIPHRMVRNWKFKTSRQYRNEVPCTEAVYGRLLHYIAAERPLLVAGGTDSGRVSIEKLIGVVKRALCACECTCM